MEVANYCMLLLADFVRLLYDLYLYYHILRKEINMKRIITVIIILVCLFGITGIMYSLNNQEYYDIINYSDIQSTVSGKDITYIVLSSDTCVTCKKLESDLKDLTQENQKIADTHFYCVKLTDENCDVIFKQFQIEGAPAILKYENGEYKEKLYKHITKEKILSFVV